MEAKVIVVGAAVYQCHRLDGVGPRLRGLEHPADRRVADVGHDHIVARRQVGEGIVTIGVGERRADQVVHARRDDAVTVHVQPQVDRHALDARLARVAEAVTVEVAPDLVADSAAQPCLSSRCRATLSIKRLTRARFWYRLKQSPS